MRDGSTASNKDVVPDALSTNEVARRTGVCERTVRRAIANNQIASFRLGRRLLVPRSEVERILSPLTRT